MKLGFFKKKKEEKIETKPEINSNLTDNEYIKLEHISKTYPNGVVAVHDFNLNVKKHEFVVFVGPSGCGKSTTLRMIAGLEEITDGDLYIDKQYSNLLSPKDRNIALVFQSYALYPHMNVYDNIAFGLKMRNYPKEEINKRVLNAAEILGLTDYLNRKPKELSGGQRQRVALGRAIVRDAKVFLMDEPLSNLDAKLRVQMRSEIIRLHKKMNATTIYVTHDQTEAMTMADKIVVMKDGYIQQIGTPKEIYDNPNNKFVAEFIGSPSTNICKCIYNNGIIYFDESNFIELPNEFKIKHDEFYNNLDINLDEEIKKEEEFINLESNKKKKDEKALLKANENLTSLLEKKDCLNKIKNNKPHEIYFAIRPEDIHHHIDANKQYEKSKYFNPIISLSELLGNEFYVHINLSNFELVAKVPFMERIYKSGEEFKIHFDMGKIHLFDFITTKSIK
ncbi:MAG: ABC transporter ATP-binding protein [bacterium]|nr:ABC transporter ATP-binding protein [bacterium]